MAQREAVVTNVGTVRFPIASDPTVEAAIQAVLTRLNIAYVTPIVLVTRRVGNATSAEFRNTGHPVIDNPEVINDPEISANIPAENLYFPIERQIELTNTSRNLLTDSLTSLWEIHIPDGPAGICVSFI